MLDELGSGWGSVLLHFVIHEAGDLLSDRQDAVFKRAFPVLGTKIGRLDKLHRVNQRTSA